MGHLPQLADFGDKAWAWPRDPMQAVRTSFPAPQLQDLRKKLQWRLVDHVAFQVRGRTACVAMLSVPMLDPLPGASLGYATDSAMPGGASSSTTQTVALGAPSLPTAFVLCVWAVYEAQRTPEARTLAVMSVHHNDRASVEADAAKGVTWWSRA